MVDDLKLYLYFGFGFEFQWLTLRGWVWKGILMQRGYRRSIGWGLHNIFLINKIGKKNKIE